MAVGSSRGRLTPRWRRTAASTVMFALLGFLVVLPVAVLLLASVTDTPPRPGTAVGAFNLSYYGSILSGGSNTAFMNSVLLALGGTALAFVIGVSLAWLAARTDVPARWLVQLAGIMPLFISSLVGAIAWSLLASPRQGYLNLILRDLGLPLTVNVYSIAGVIFVFGLYYAPYVFLLTHSALSLMNHELEEAAFVHGANTRRATRLVTLPLVAPAMLGSCILTFALIIENFPVAEVLAASAGIESIPSQIFRLMNTFPPRSNQAAAIGFVLLVMVMVLVGLQRRLLRRHDYTTITGKGFRPRYLPLGRLRWVAFLIPAGYLAVAVGLPLFALVQSGLRANLYVPDAAALFDASAFGLDHVHRVLGDNTFRLGLRNSIVVGVATAVVGGVLCLVLGYAVYRSKLPGREGFRYLAMTPLAIPALVLGLAFLWTWTMLPVGLYGTVTILVLAYTVRFLPQGFQGISASINQIHPDLEESAYLSGASRLRATLSVGVPLLRTSIVSTMLLLLILAMRELSAAIFLFTTRTRVISLVLYDKWDSGLMGQTAVISLIYSIFLFIVTIVGRRWFSVT